MVAMHSLMVSFETLLKKRCGQKMFSICCQVRPQKQGFVFRFAQRGVTSFFQVFKKCASKLVLINFVKRYSVYARSYLYGSECLLIRKISQSADQFRINFKKHEWDY